MSDIVERLKEYAEDDHERGCEGRYYDCSCGYDGKRDPLLKEAADEIERLRKALRFYAGADNYKPRAEAFGDGMYAPLVILDAGYNARAALKEDGDD